MNSLKIKGGYGEHGRSCFMVEYKPSRYVMVDCGILDTDPHPEPHISHEEAEATDYLFLTHAHKDHTGALDYLLNKGFQGELIATEDTFRFCRITYENRTALPYVYPGTLERDGIEVIYGRSGHCPGSLWYQIKTEDKTFFFSGDYQANSLVYATDVPHGMKADVALVDMAHDTCEEDASTLRDKLVSMIEKYREEKRKVILPVQTFGRGNEILYLLKERFPDSRIALDERFVNAEEMMLENTAWMQEETKLAFLEAYEVAMRTPTEEAEIILIADTHLMREENRTFVKEMLAKEAVVILTGRRKKGSFCVQLLDEGKAVHTPFPHHSSRLDAKVLVENNQFDIVLPFHTDVKEIWY